MSNNDISRVSSNLIPHENIGSSKETENKRKNSGTTQGNEKIPTPPADITISEEGIKRLEASKVKNADHNSNPSEIMKKIHENSKSLTKAHTGMSPAKVAELLKD